jgi:DNA processing protein
LQQFGAARGLAASYANEMKPASLPEAAALVALLRTRASGVSWAEITSEVLAAGGALAVWDTRGAVTDADADPFATAVGDITRWAYRGWAFLTMLDESYPAPLRDMEKPPPFLFASGPVSPGGPTVSVTGTRKASSEGLELAYGISRALASRGLTVASGLSAGIDAQAHRAALDAGGRTAAVLATGLSGVYPPGHRALQRQVAARGLLLSQFWPDTPARRANFLIRIATLASLSLATVVVESGDRSGARVQAHLAREQGRAVILTDLVVANRAWARAMLSLPGVHQAGGPQAVLRIVEPLAAEHSAVTGDRHGTASA